MRAHSAHAYIVPSTDAHMVRGQPPPMSQGAGWPPPGHFSRPHPPLQSEYIAERDSRLGWLTGFTGSAGESILATPGTTPRPLGSPPWGGPQGHLQDLGEPGRGGRGDA